MFHLNEHEVRMVNVNVRPELHGEEAVTAVDLKIEAKMPNNILFEFDPSLKLILYVKDPNPELIDQPEHLTKLRFPQIGYPIKWDEEIIGAKAVFHLGVSGKRSDVTLEMCDVNEFRFEPQEGGTVVVTFRIQTKPDEKQLGKLGMMAGCDVILSVVPPGEAGEVTA